jgi:hypothetical protein
LFFCFALLSSFLLLLDALTRFSNLQKLAVYFPETTDPAKIILDALPNSIRKLQLNGIYTENTDKWVIDALERFSRLETFYFLIKNSSEPISIERIIAELDRRRLRFPRMRSFASTGCLPPKMLDAAMRIFPNAFSQIRRKFPRLIWARAEEGNMAGGWEARPKFSVTEFASEKFQGVEKSFGVFSFVFSQKWSSKFGF